MPDQPISPEVKNLNPERLEAGPRSTPLPPPSDEARRTFAATLAQDLAQARVERERTPAEFQNFESLMGKLVQVPKFELDEKRREA